MKKVVILGGSFDPFHNGHLEIAKKALDVLNADEIWLLPARNARWKKNQTSINKRLKMLELIVQNESNFHICKYEIEEKGKNYTYNTMLRLTTDYPDNQFYFIIGADQVERLPDWYKVDQLAKIVTLVTFNRPNYLINDQIIKKYNCLMIEHELIDIASSAIRQTLNFDYLPIYLKQFLENNLYYHKKKLKTMITKERFSHSLSVTKLALEIAKHNDYDGTETQLAALLHDCAKDQNHEIIMEIMREHYANHLSDNNKLFHQYCGAYLAQKEFSVKQDRVLDAIMWHTSGRAHMTTLDKIIYVADKLDPLRGYDSKAMIKACINNIDEGFLIVIKDNLRYFKKRNIDIYNKESLEMFKQYLKEEIK